MVKLSKLLSKSIYLRKAEPEDSVLISKWFNDADNVKYMSTIVRCMAHSEKSVANDILESDESFERLFMVCLEENKMPVGHAGIDDIDFNDKRAEIFCLIGEKAEQGKGYGCQAISLLLDYGFNNLSLNSLFATSAVENKASISILEKLGFRKIGIRREYNNIGGRYVDEAFFDITRKDYVALRNDNLPKKQVGLESGKF